MSAVAYHRNASEHDQPATPSELSPSTLNLKPIPREKNIGREDFRRLYLEPRRPVILESLACDWPALSKWTFEYLGQSYGRREVRIFDSSFADPGASYMSAVRSLPFADYLQQVVSGSLDARMFLYNIASEMPQLADDVKLPTIVDGCSKRFIFLFAGCTGSATPIHFDIDMAHVFHTPIVGARRVTLFAPQESRHLYRHPFTVRSYIDVGAPDFDKHPLLRRARGYQDHLRAGETLFMPSEFWHFVEYEEGGYSISLRCRNERLLARAKGYWFLGVLSPIDRLMNRLFGQAWFAWKDARAHTR